MDLTSRDGDWFLDELCSMSSNVLNTLEMLTVKPLLPHDLSLKIVTAMKSSDAVYTSLQELNVHFRTIIVPETIKCLESGEATVARNVAALQSLINALDQPLDTLITALEKQLLNAIMGLQVRVDPLTSCVSTECYLCSKTCVLFQPEDGGWLKQVRRMRVAYDELLQGGSESNTLSPGQMLFMGFNGLFTRYVFLCKPYNCLSNPLAVDQKA